MIPEPVVELRGITKRYLGKTAVEDVSLAIYPGQVTCLLGHNGAGKSTLIKILSGVEAPTSGTILINGKPTKLSDPHHARAHGIATVHQEVGTIPLMSVARNFFLGAEPRHRVGPFQFLDAKKAERIAVEEIRKIGIRRVTNGGQAVGTLSGGEREALAIARAMYFGAKLLILDEPTSDLGVREAAVVLRLIGELRKRGVAVVFVTHNAHHALRVGDEFAVLIHGALADGFSKGERQPATVLDLMAGGTELAALELKYDQDHEDIEALQ